MLHWTGQRWAAPVRLPIPVQAVVAPSAAQLWAFGDVTKPGQIVLLNGAPRSGKSSIVAVIQETFDGPWMNLGVDVFVRAVTPKRY